MDIFGFCMTQSGELHSIKQFESMSKYPTPKNIHNMRGFMWLVNQSTFCVSPETRKTMEKLKDNLKSTKTWKSDKNDQNNLDAMKKQLVKDCEKGIKRLSSHGETPLVLISDWSNAGSGFTFYEVTCKHPENWDISIEAFVVKTLCCPEKWRLIIAGGRYNKTTEAGYAPVEGELLGIVAALHKTRYFKSGHPKVTVIMDHKPILNLIQDRNKTINNKRLTNLRRKCNGYIFQTGYGKGLDNITNAISQITEW